MFLIYPLQISTICFLIVNFCFKKTRNKTTHFRRQSWDVTAFRLNIHRKPTNFSTGNAFFFPVANNVVECSILREQEIVGHKKKRRVTVKRLLNSPYVCTRQFLTRGPPSI